MSTYTLMHNAQRTYFCDVTEFPCSSSCIKALITDYLFHPKHVAYASDWQC